MDIEKIKMNLLSSSEKNEIDQLIKFSFDTSLSYLISKNNYKKLSDGNLQLEELAISTSASLFCEDEHGNVQLIPEYQQKLKELDNKIDFEYYMFEIIRAKLEKSIKQQFL